MRRPDIVVGIDIGQTCSGVAYSIGPDWCDPRTLNRWPGFNGIERADKVATRVGYSKTDGELLSWGFESNFGDRNTLVREQFKLTIDDEYEDDRGFSHEQARRWYLDYLRCLHREIENFLEASVPRWRSLNIEYSFSTPTTWTSPAMVAAIEKIIKAAGYADNERQSVRMGLTEAEAAAIEACAIQYRVGDVFLICDAGGGTTDVNLLKIKSIHPKLELEPLDHVEGVPIGSTLIDYHMARHIVERLELIRDELEGDPFYLAEEMLIGRFQTVKHSFPHPVVDDFSLDVAGLAGRQSFPQAGIRNSKMIIERATLKEIFDEQIEQIFGLIDDRILSLQAELPNEQVAYIVLSGGLGSSPYLYQQIGQRYEKNVNFRSNNTASIRVMRVTDPQLTVVRGLVRERTQQLGKDGDAGQEIFRTRRCRNSYGIATRVPYNEAMHAGLPYVVSGVDKRRWVENVVDWFIKQGDVIDPSQGVRRAYGLTLADHQRDLQQKVRIVMSSSPPNQLPHWTTDDACQNIVTVKYYISQKDMTLVKQPILKQQLWKKKKKIWRASFFFVVNLGPADIKFQIVGSDGVLSLGHDSLEVDYMDTSEPTALPVEPQSNSPKDPITVTERPASVAPLR